MKNNPNKSIKAIVFDYGGVIELNEGGHILKSIAELIGVPITDLESEYFKHNHLANVKNLPWEDMLMKVVSVFTDNKEIKEKIPPVIKEYQSKRKINTGLLALFPILKRQGLKVGIFSNSSSELRERVNSNGIAKLVDEVVISGEIGFQKPHKEAFQVLFEKLNVQPEEAIFIDDVPKSLEKAEEIGYLPILFKNNEQLKTDLKDMGISLF